MNVLRISQLVAEDDLQEIISLTAQDTMWERLHRVFAEQAGDDTPLQCWLDWLDEDGETILDDPITISADQAKWLLRDFFRRPEAEWKAVKVSLPAFAGQDSLANLRTRGSDVRCETFRGAKRVVCKE